MPEPHQEVVAPSITLYKPRTEDFDVIRSIISSKAQEYGVSEAVLIHIVSNESHFRQYAVGDEDYFCKRTGTFGPSYGLVQINSCWHPEVSYDQATDPLFAIDFLAKAIRAGRCYEWSTCPL